MDVIESDEEVVVEDIGNGNESATHEDNANEEANMFEENEGEIYLDDEY